MNTPIKDWNIFDQPREKLLRNKSALLSNAELLAILINSGNKNKSALLLAEEILTRVNNNLVLLSRLSISELLKIEGIGRSKAAVIIACMEISRRKIISQSLPQVAINSPKDAIVFLSANLRYYSHEVFGVVYLNNANKILAFELISEGGLTATLADPRMIFRRALELSAIKIILCHNHPSGNVSPSNADLQLTRRLIAAGQVLDITVIDHIIIGPEDHYIFSENGVLT